MILIVAPNLNPPMDNHRFMLPLLLLTISFFFTFSLYAIRRRRLRHSPSLITDIVRTVNTNDRITSSTNSNSSLLLEIWPETKKSEDTAAGADDECETKRKKKRRTKKKRVSDCEVKSDGIGNEKEKENELVSLYPFTSASSATQRRIKQQYDQLVKSHGSNGLTLLQVSQFVNCLIEARTELKHKSEVIHRKFTITKALLFKADRSSFDRLRQQIYKLELEQKRLEEDAFVYNWLQQQLKLSPAYKKMLEVGASMESKAKAIEATEDSDLDIFDISFEELLAQEKKDSFWQKKVKPKSGSG